MKVTGQETWGSNHREEAIKGGESEVAQSCPTLCDPKDCSLPGSSVHRIFQARVLEWGAIAFSEGPHRVSLLRWLIMLTSQTKNKITVILETDQTDQTTF